VVAVFFFPVNAKEETKKIHVKTSSELIQTFKSSTPNIILLLESGINSGNIYPRDIEGKNIVIEGIDPDNPPV
jgi:hypothetical protein